MSAIKSPIRWRGGKYKLVKEIVPIIPEHVCYVEPFFGAGHVFFSKEPSKVEVIGDINDDLINLFKTAKEEPEKLINEFKYSLPSRKIFNDLKNNSKKLSNVQRAYKLYYMMKNAFAGRLDNPCFGISAVSKSRFDPLQIEEDIQNMHSRFAKTACYIECDDFEKIIKRYDRPTTFHYIDPPYYDTDGYKNNFTGEDHTRLKNVLSNTTGKWLLSINNCPEILEMYKKIPDITIKIVSTNYSSSSTDKGRDKVQELLIANYVI